MVPGGPARSDPCSDLRRFSASGQQDKGLEGRASAVLIPRRREGGWGAGSVGLMPWCTCDLEAGLLRALLSEVQTN